MPKNNKISDEIKQLKAIDRDIRRLEKQRVLIESRLVHDAGGARSALRRHHTRKSLKSYAFLQFKRRRLAYFLVGSAGVILFWIGLWDLVDKHNVNPFLLMASGVCIIWLTRNYR